MVDHILEIATPFLTPAQNAGTTGGEWLDDTPQLGGALCPPDVTDPFDYPRTERLMRSHDEKVVEYITTLPPGVAPYQMYNEASFKKFATGSRARRHDLKLFNIVLKVGNIAINSHYFNRIQIGMCCKFRHLMWNRFLVLPYDYFQRNLHLELDSRLQIAIINRLDNQGRPSFHIPTRGYWERKCEDLLETRRRRIEENIIHGLNIRQQERADFIANIPEGFEFAGPAPGEGWRMRLSGEEPCYQRPGS
jgi:hypothetical protein